VPLEDGAAGVKELKDDPMLTDLALREVPIGAVSEPSLSVLAEHLSAIADALRRTGARDMVDAAPTSMAQSVASSPLSPTQITESRTDLRTQPSSHSAPSHPAPNHPPTNHPDAKLQRAIFADLARHAYATRRRRTAIFKNDELFGEPAWDILLDLYIAHAENKPVSVSSACIGSAAPPTTGLRWLGVLSEQGLILREHDPEDQRRVLVRLTDEGLAAMDEHFASAGVTA